MKRSKTREYFCIQKKSGFVITLFIFGLLTTKQVVYAQKGTLIFQDGKKQKADIHEINDDFIQLTPLSNIAKKPKLTKKKATELEVIPAGYVKRIKWDNAQTLSLIKSNNPYVAEHQPNALLPNISVGIYLGVSTALNIGGNIEAMLFNDYLGVNGWVAEGLLAAQAGAAVRLFVVPGKIGFKFGVFRAIGVFNSRSDNGTIRIRNSYYGVAGFTYYADPPAKSDARFFWGIEYSENLAGKRFQQLLVKKGNPDTTARDLAEYSLPIGASLIIGVSFAIW